MQDLTSLPFSYFSLPALDFNTRLLINKKENHLSLNHLAEAATHKSNDLKSDIKTSTLNLAMTIFMSLFLH